MVNTIVNHTVATWQFCAPVHGFTLAIWKIAEFSTYEANKFNIVTHATRNCNTIPVLHLLFQFTQDTWPRMHNIYNL